jgi:hypothetical protein
VGIDVYMRWTGQTEAEKEAQYTGFSIVHGHVGYLREAYHGEPYATHVLVPEAFASDDVVPIPAATMRARLTATEAAVEQRHRTVYDDADAVIECYKQSYRDFVALAERKEAELGEPVRVMVSG